MSTARVLAGASALRTAIGWLLVTSAAATPAPSLAGDVDLQPLAAQVKRLVEALDYLGSPLAEGERQTLDAAMTASDSDKAAGNIQQILDAHCLVSIDINPEMRVKVAQGPTRPELVEQGWRTFLVKVQNEAGATAELRAVSPNAQSAHDSPSKRTASDAYYRKRGPATGHLPVGQLWLALETFDKQPLKKPLSGRPLDYRVLSLYSRDAGQREAKLSFNVGPGA